MCCWCDSSRPQGLSPESIFFNTRTSNFHKRIACGSPMRFWNFIHCVTRLLRTPCSGCADLGYFVYVRTKKTRIDFRQWLAMMKRVVAECADWKLLRSSAVEHFHWKKKVAGAIPVERRKAHAFVDFHPRPLTSLISFAERIVQDRDTSIGSIPISPSKTLGNCSWWAAGSDTGI